MFWRGSAYSLRVMGLFYTPDSAMTAQAQTLKGVKEQQHMLFELAHSLMQEIYVVKNTSQADREIMSSLERKDRCVMVHRATKVSEYNMRSF